MEKHPFRKGIPVFTRSQAGEFFIEFHKIMAVGEAQGTADFQDCHVRIGEHEISLINFRFHYVPL